MQARLLRVFYYNMLWHYFGNVPFYLENLSEPPYTAPQYTADQVYAELIAELEAVIDSKVLPLKYYKTIKEGKEVDDEGQLGRVTQAMAYMVYAEMVMYQNDESRYGKALQYMQEIIGSTQYGLLENYAGIFKEANEWGKESIFEVNYKDDDAIRSWDGPLNAGGTVLPTLVSPHTWPNGTDGHDEGWGFCPVRLETYERYANNDTRRDATCWNAQAAIDAHNAANPTNQLTYNHRYQDTGYFLEKYAAHTGDNSGHKADAQLNWNNNLRIYRFSETLLNAAELITRGAGSGDAREYLNRVRKRAGLTTEKEATIDNIIDERHLEFVGEGKRYWDLIRTGKATSVLVPDGYGYRTNTWSANKKHLPIPQSEIDAAQGTLIQNNY